VEPARALGEDTLQRSRQVFGSDHLITLLAGAALTRALFSVGEVEAARAVGEDTLEGCRRVLGPGHAITLFLARATGISPPCLMQIHPRTTWVGRCEHSMHCLGPAAMRGEVPRGRAGAARRGRWV
jgi:hypothetical protein